MPRSWQVGTGSRTNSSIMNGGGIRNAGAAQESQVAGGGSRPVRTSLARCLHHRENVGCADTEKPPAAAEVAGSTPHRSAETLRSRVLIVKARLISRSSRRVDQSAVSSVIVNLGVVLNAGEAAP